MINVNCIYNEKGAWCNNKNIKRSLLGLGARCCSEYGKFTCKDCPYSKPSPRPIKEEIIYDNDTCE